MTELRPSPLRARLILLVLFSLLPAILLLAYTTAESRSRAVADVEENASTLVHLVAANKEEAATEARRLLFALSLLREVRGGDAEACTARLTEILRVYSGYSNFGVAEGDGDVFCGTAASAEPANVADRAWFRHAVETLGFALGDYQPGRTPGTAILVFAYPIVDVASPSSAPLGVVFAEAPLVGVSVAAADVPLPEGTVILETDSRGTVTDHYPDPERWVGRRLPAAPLIQAMLAEGEGVAELPSLDETPRLFAFTPLYGAGGASYHLGVGIPLQFVADESNRLLLRNLAWLALAGVLTLGLAWWGSEAFILRWIKRLGDVTERLSQGDLSARAALPLGSGEIGQLGRAFDGMAATLEQREAERQASAAILQAERERLSVTLASIGDGVITTDARGRVAFLNGVAQALTGWGIDEAAGRPLDEVFPLIKEDTAERAENPAAQVLREGVITGLAAHRLLVARDGSHIPIDDSAAPIRDSRGTLIGVVLVFRDARERRRADQAVRQSRDEVTAILKGTAEGITAEDRDGRLRYANDAAAHLLGYPSAEALLSAPLAESRHKVEMFDETGQPFPAERLPGRLAMQGEPLTAVTLRYRNRATGEERWAAVKATPVLDAHGRVELVVNVLQDITDLKQAEISQRLLAEAGRLLAAQLDPSAQLASIAKLAVPLLADWCAVDVLDSEARLQRVAVAHAGSDKAWLAPQPPQGQPLDAATPRGIAQALRTGASQFYSVIADELFEADGQAGEPLGIPRGAGLTSAMVVPLNARGRTLGALTLAWAARAQPTGGAKWELAEELARRTALALDNANLYAEAQELNVELENIVNRRTAQLQASNARLLNEVAERKEAQRRLEESRAQLRRLSAHQQATREEERTRIAREIHDELGQALAGLKMDLAWLQRALEGRDTNVQEKLRDVARLIDDTVGMVRRIATELRPRILDELGLAAAIEWQLDEFRTRTGLDCRLRSNIETLALDADQATAIFRLFQEALTNIARHAEATRVTVTVKQKADHLSLRVEDDGRGIAEADIAQTRSFGLLSMRERVHFLGGDMSIRGTPGRGTTIAVRIPLHRDEAQPGR